MLLTLHLPAQTERKLQELTARSGLDPADYVLTVIHSHVETYEGGAVADLEGDLLAEAVARMTGRTPEQAAEIRMRAEGSIRRGRPLAAGETLMDAVAGRWPGEESDAEVAEALRKLS
ncbi:MAG TPA: hypothetical protein VK689_07425 [Armatimonadota bacterium]|nr:hypothetical protein [Armatimonadota bacterium]